jgi:hypothetical protein
VTALSLGHKRRKKAEAMSLSARVINAVGIAVDLGLPSVQLFVAEPPLSNQFFWVGVFIFSEL